MSRETEVTTQDNNLITMQNLGRKGRFGNALFQYIFIRTYAKRYGLDYEVPRWIGQQLFGHKDPLLAHELPPYHEKRAPTKYPEGPLAETFPPKGDEVRGHDFNGYAQFHTGYYREDRAFIRNLFRPVPSIYNTLALLCRKLPWDDQTVIGLQLRRGDTGRFIFYLTPNEWYLTWLREHWSRFTNPVLFIASEDPIDAEAFAEYRPVVSTEMLPLSAEPYPVYNYLISELNSPTPTSMDWFPDWYFLSQCRVLLIGNSTFGFTAAMMNPQLKECWRSKLSTQSFERIEPWNAAPITREDLRDHPGIPGTYYVTNPKWIGGEVIGRK